LNAGDGADSYLPPGPSHPWFLSVIDGGYVNRTGRVNSFSIFVNDTPGSETGVTYVTNHAPMPQPLIEGGASPVTLWIPENQSSTGVGPQAAGVTMLAPPRPNPASSAARFDFVIGTSLAAGRPVPVSLTIHDVQGRLVRTVYEGAHDAGRYSTSWDTRDEGGRPVAVGLYYARFHAGDASAQEKVLVVR
jgi:hypothetical protein